MQQQTRARRLLASLGIGLLTMAATAACAPAESTPPPGTDPEFVATGLIVEAPVDGVVSVAHEAIPGFMPAMTMPFTLRDAEDAARLAPGDRVRFRLTVSPTATRAHTFEVVGHDAATLEAYRRSASVASARVREGDLLPPFALVDQEGRPISGDRLQGHRTVLTFIFTRCPVPEFCPRITGYFKELQGDLAADPALADVRLLSVTLDPEFDTPAVMKAYGEGMGADFTRWWFATGGADDVAVLTRALAVQAEPSSAILDHTLATAVIDADGRVLAIWRGNQWTVDEVLARLRS